MPSMVVNRQLNVILLSILFNFIISYSKEHSLCRIISHFINECEEPSLNNLRFILVDSVNNVHSSSRDEVPTLLLQKERFCIGDPTLESYIFWTSPKNRENRIFVQFVAFFHTSYGKTGKYNK